MAGWGEWSTTGSQRGSGCEAACLSQGPPESRAWARVKLPSLLVRGARPGRGGGNQGTGSRPGEGFGVRGRHTGRHQTVSRKRQAIVLGRHRGVSLRMVCTEGNLTRAEVRGGACPTPVS